MNIPEKHIQKLLYIIVIIIILTAVTIAVSQAQNI